MEKWPNFFIVGVQKGGTTSLHEYLNKVPDVFMSKLKEPTYFSSDKIGNQALMEIVRNKKKYLSLFQKSNSKVRGESSVDYFEDLDAATRIKEQVPNAKILISLRDPVERSYSHYWMLRSRERVKMNFREKIDHDLKELPNIENNVLVINNIIKGSLYSYNLKKYLEIFGKRHLKVVFFEDLVRTPTTVINEILRFLEVDYKFENFDGKAYNTPRGPRGGIAKSILENRTLVKLAQKFLPPDFRTEIGEKMFTKDKPKPKMKQSDKDLLVQIFSGDVQKVSNFLNRELPWKNFPRHI